MDLIERYLNEVGRRLSKGQRDDIRDELRSTLADALETRGDAEPSEDDVVAALVELGSPETVAASYSGDRYLIGPRLYPQFKTTLRVVVTVLAAVVLFGFALSISGTTSELSKLAMRLGEVFSELLEVGITSVGIVVIVFAVLERLGAGEELTTARTWDPRTLPVVRDVDLVGRFDSIAGIVFPAIILILINQFRDRIGLVVSLSPGDFAAGIVSERPAELLLNDVFLDNLPWLNTSLLLPMALSVWLLWAGRWHWTTRILKIAFSLFGLYVLQRICQGAIAGQGQLLDAGIPETVVEIFVRAATLAPFIIAGFLLYEAAQHLYRAYRSVA
ncbi:MAG: hypothetical protein ACE5GX_10800 [Thermoanaerobaculia bacterium]